MIIECINCSKIFDVNSDLIPSTGRTIQCGSCNHVWFFNPNKANLKINEEIQPKISIPIFIARIDLANESFLFFITSPA